MNEQIITETRPVKQAPAQTPRQTRRVISRGLGGLNLYEFLRGDDDPPWNALTAKQQSRFIAGFEIGASSVDLRRALGRG